MKIVPICSTRASFSVAAKTASVIPPISALFSFISPDFHSFSCLICNVMWYFILNLGWKKEHFFYKHVLQFNLKCSAQLFISVVFKKSYLSFFRWFSTTPTGIQLLINRPWIEPIVLAKPSKWPSIAWFARALSKNAYCRGLVKKVR